MDIFLMKTQKMSQRTVSSLLTWSIRTSLRKKNSTSFRTLRPKASKRKKEYSEFMANWFTTQPPHFGCLIARILSDSHLFGSLSGGTY
jgi:hypothetical protein